VCDGQGRPVCLHLTAGQVIDFKGADALLADLPDDTEEVIRDRGYDSNLIRLSLAERNITACIPRKRTGNQSRLATRYDRCARTFMSAIQVAASFIFYLKE
jgi:transposase